MRRAYPALVVLSVFIWELGIRDVARDVFRDEVPSRNSHARAWTCLDNKYKMIRFPRILARCNRLSITISKPASSSLQILRLSGRLRSLDNSFINGFRRFNSTTVRKPTDRMRYCEVAMEIIDISNSNKTLRLSQDPSHLPCRSF